MYFISFYLLKKIILFIFSIYQKEKKFNEIFLFFKFWLFIKKNIGFLLEFIYF